MSPGSKQRSIQIRPLSEGIGLGTLHSTKTQSPSSILAQRETSSNIPPQNSFVAKNAHAAYAPHSVATQIRSRQSSRWYVTLSRFCVGLGLDIFVGSFSVFILAWCGVLAWSSGSTGDFNPLSALITVTDALEAMSLTKVCIAVIAVAFVLRAWRILLIAPRSAPN